MRKQNKPAIFAGVLLVIWGILYDFLALDVFGALFIIFGIRGKEVEENKNTLLAQRLKELAEKGQSEEKEEKTKKEDDEPLFNFEDNG